MSTSAEMVDLSKWLMYFTIATLAVGSILIIGFTDLGMSIREKLTDHERTVFEHSDQRQSGLQSKIDTLEAQTAQISVQLENTELSDTDRNTLKSQLAALGVQLDSARAALQRSQE